MLVPNLLRLSYRYQRECCIGYTTAKMSPTCFLSAWGFWQLHLYC